MREFWLKTRENLKDSAWILLIIPLFLLIFILFVGYVLYAPFEMILYYHSPYYKRTGKRYAPFLMATVYVRLYNRIAKHGLPIEYASNDGLEYFIKDGAVYLVDWCEEVIDEQNGEWGFEVDEDSGDVSFVSAWETLKSEREHIKEEHRDMLIYFLIFTDDDPDDELIGRAKECPYFRFAKSVSDFAPIEK